MPTSRNMARYPTQSCYRLKGSQSVLSLSNNAKQQEMTLVHLVSFGKSTGWLPRWVVESSNPSRLIPMTYNIWCVSLPSLVFDSNMIRQGSIAPYQDKMIEWDIGSWCWQPSPQLAQHYKVVMGVHCHNLLPIPIWPYVLLGCKTPTESLFSIIYLVEWRQAQKQPNGTAHSQMGVVGGHLCTDYYYYNNYFHYYHHNYYCRK